MREIEKNPMYYDGAALKPVLRYIHFCKKYEFVFFEWLPIAFVSFMSDVEKLKTSFFLAHKNDLPISKPLIAFVIYSALYYLFMQISQPSLDKRLLEAKA